MDEEKELWQNMFPCFYHVVERICNPSWSIKKETFKHHNIILIYDGEAVFGCNGREYLGKRGDLIYYKPGDFRWAGTFPENLMKCYAVDFLYTCPVYEERKWEYKSLNLPFNTVERINDGYLFLRLLDLFDDFTKAWISGKHNRVVRCRTIFMEMVSLLIAWKYGNNINYDKLRKIEKVISYMAENYQKQISLEELSSVIQISASYLGTIFKEVTGESPVEYLIKIRINKAKELLRDGHSVSDAAYKVGFNDIYYFSKSFKKHEGFTPSEIKKIPDY